MKRGFPLVMSILFAGAAEAHVSPQSVSLHALEHLWLLLAVVPALWLVKPVLRQLQKTRQR